MMKTTLALAAVGAASLFTLTSVVPADAAIKCQGRNMWNSAANAWIPQPYCEDKLIAYVSGYPFNGPNGVRQNPSVKAEACRFAGSDIRIRDLCAGHLPEDDGNRRR
ncbi:MAG: hypothetical protein MPJ78_07015 [Hyphomicrobiaceae bacterium]|nr:hypothetical protein [Hyphomicrobiaceae bacterium]